MLSQVPPCAGRVKTEDCRVNSDLAYEFFIAFSGPRAA